MDETHPPDFAPTQLTLDPPKPCPSYNSVGRIFCKLNSLFKYIMEAYLALIGGARLWVTNICGLGIKSFIAPSKRLTIGAHEALTTKMKPQRDLVPA